MCGVVGECEVQAVGLDMCYWCGKGEGEWQVDIVVVGGVMFDIDAFGFVFVFVAVAVIIGSWVSVNGSYGVGLRSESE